MLQEVTSVQDFRSIIADNPRVCMEFYATWCPHCKHFFPVVEEFAKQQDGKVAVAQVALDQFPELFNEFNVESFPCVIYFQDGQEIARTLGDQSLQDLDNFLSKAEAETNTELGA